ncbi:MAG: host attachment protein [Roseivivax sp.]|nr:host attachment protein [Roseivivax sp.]
MTRAKTWALVTNGVRARILPALEEGATAEPQELVSKAKSTHLRDILSDKAGRSFSSDSSGRRSAMEPGSDPILRDMQDFAQETLAVLGDHFHAGRLTQLAVFASPKMLGILRQEMPSDLRSAVVLERDLNLINLPEADLRETVVKAFREGASA